MDVYGSLTRDNVWRSAGELLLGDDDGAGCAKDPLFFGSSRVLTFNDPRREGGRLGPGGAGGPGGPWGVGGPEKGWNARSQLCFRLLSVTNTGGGVG